MPRAGALAVSAGTTEQSSNNFTKSKRGLLTSATAPFRIPRGVKEESPTKKKICHKCGWQPVCQAQTSVRLSFPRLVNSSLSIWTSNLERAKRCEEARCVCSETWWPSTSLRLDCLLLPWLVHTKHTQ